MEEIPEKKKTFQDLKMIVPKRSDERKILEARRPSKGISQTKKVDPSQLDQVLQREKRSLEEKKEGSKAKKAKVMEPEANPNLKRKAQASALRKAAARITQKNLPRKMPREIVAFPVGPGPSSHKAFPDPLEECVFAKHIRKQIEEKGNLAFPRKEPDSFMCSPITCRKMVDDPEAVLEEDWCEHFPMTPGEYLSLPSTSKFRQEKEKDLDFLPPHRRQYFAALELPPPVTREFLSSDSESEDERIEKKAESASEIAKRLAEEMRLTDSESEDETQEETINQGSEMEMEVDKLEAEIKKIDVELTTEEVEMELEEMEKGIQEEEEAIRELERKLEEKQANKEIICGGLQLDMPWQLKPLTLEDKPTGSRQEWLDQIYKNKALTLNISEDETQTVSVDPRGSTRCRKCRKRFHTASNCPNKTTQN